MCQFFKYFISGAFILVLTSPVFSQTTRPVGLDTIQNNDEAYHQYDGKIIDKIEIHVIDISEVSIDNKEKFDTSWLYKAANTLHIKTKDWVVREWLLFSEGDKFESKLIEESERLLRNSGAFVDALIKVVPKSDDAVDLIVLAQDKWTFTLNLSYSTVNESYLGIKDDNVLGFGHNIDASVTHNQDKNIGTGLRGSYTGNNIAGSYINGEIHLETNKKTDIQSLNFSRPFISNEIDWAGGISVTRESNKLSILQNNASLLLPYKIHIYDLWIGRSFPVWFGSETFRNNTRIIFSGRFNKIEHTEKPDELFGVNDLFTNSNLYLIKGGIINRRFYEDSFIEGFGRTEDVPIGGLIDVTFGTDKREEISRVYTAVKGILSRRIENFGYASLLVEIGAFKNRGVLEQSVFNFNFLYHSPLIKTGSWKQRFFLLTDYLLGFNRFEGEQIYLNQKTGLRGINEITLFGSKRAVLNIEDRLFSPFSLWGFGFGASGFIDMGLLSGEGQSLVSSRLYQAYGFTFRITNESIARAQFAVGLVYNNYLPTQESGGVSLIFSANFLMGIRNFEFLRPYVFGFKEN